MWIDFRQCVCDICRITEDIEKLKEWRSNNPDIITKWDGSRPDLAKILKDNGYYGWERTIQPVVYIEADCHGDSMQLCKKHFQSEILDRF